jgi:transposase
VICTRDLTDVQWAVLEPLFAPPLSRPDRRGRPWADTRGVMNGVLFILRTGAPGRDLPDCYPSRSTCHRRFQQWIRQGLFRRLLNDLASVLLDWGLLNLSECYIDGTFAPAKRGGLQVGKTKRGKGSKLMAVADGEGSPLAVMISRATPHEVTLVEPTLSTRFVEELPTRLIGDNAYDSDKLDAELATQGVEVIAPHRKNRVHKTQDGRPLRRYKRRWRVERLFAWLYCFRRLVVRWEVRAENWLGFVQLGCVLILLRRCLGSRTN